MTVISTDIQESGDKKQHIALTEPYGDERKCAEAAAKEFGKYDGTPSYRELMCATPYVEPNSEYAELVRASSKIQYERRELSPDEVREEYDRKVSPDAEREYIGSGVPALVKHTWSHER